MIRRGVWLGAFTGLILAGAYAALALQLMGLVMLVGNAAKGEGWMTLPAVSGLAFCGLPMAMFLGVLPGLLVGALGGLILGMLTALLRPSPLGGALLGILVGLGVAVGLHFSIGRDFLAGYLRPPGYSGSLYGPLPYLFWVVGPGILSILGAGWAGVRLTKAPRFPEVSSPAT